MPIHKTTTLTVSDTAVTMTVTDSTNISSLDEFNLVLCSCMCNTVTGSPLPLNVTVNGTAVPVYNKYSLPIYSNRLRSRKLYHGAFVTSGNSSYVILFDTPNCACYATV